VDGVAETSAASTVRIDAGSKLLDMW
jgi:hypothetical protein